MKGQDVVMMARIRNEERWIGRNLERTLLVAGKVVLWDDGSTDKTEEVCLDVLDKFADALGATREKEQIPMGWIARLYGGADGACTTEFHFLHSPFRHGEAARVKELVNEIRDKNLLWYYLKSRVTFRHVLCMDGDEMLSLEAMRRFPEAIVLLESRVDIIDMPFIYLWNTEDQQRVDGVYGSNTPDGHKQLRFPRLFTIDRLEEQQLFDNHFAWGGNRGGLHCGSVPQQDFLPNGSRPSEEDGTRAFLNMPVVHFGYFDLAMREAKYKFYTELDPDDEANGHYLHLIEQPNNLTPGPVKFAPWKDE